MKTTALLITSVAIVLAVMLSGQVKLHCDCTENTPTTKVAEARGNLPAVAVCFAPGTSEEYMAEWTRRIQERAGLDFNIGERWGRTAWNANTGAQGDPTHITYSFIADGESVDGETSVLFSRMNDLFASQAQWQNLIASVFESWSRISGLSYSLESDDGANWGGGAGSRGEMGVRGDVRIAAIPQDGASGVLAYNYFPDRGDMVLDAGENWAAAGGNFIFLRNIIAHEHGHGWGLNHVCPANGTKLLEPFYSGGYDGPQHDDTRAVQRNYGDNYENNDSQESANILGRFARDTTITPVSIDDDSDIDYYKFAIPAGNGVTITCQPVGYEYLDGTQSGGGDCNPGTTINTINDQNLTIVLKDWNGIVTRVEANSQPAGIAEQILRYQVAQAGDSFTIIIQGGAASAVQLYDLQFDLFNLSDPYLTICPIEFDSTWLNQPVQRTTSIVNPTSSTLQISSISTTGSFTVSPNTPQSIGAGQSLELTLTYLADQLNDQFGTLSVAHSGPGGTLTCDLHGKGMESGISFLTGRNIDFGEVMVSDRDSARVILRASGNVPTILYNLPIEPSSEFSVNFITPYAMNPNQTLTLWIRFHPTSIGVQNGMMVINHSALSTPDTAFFTGVGTPLAVDDERNNPLSFSLAQNYPNPFNPSTAIRYTLARATSVMLKVYDIEGRFVKELVNSNQPAGTHEVLFAANNLASGLYFYKLHTPEFTAINKMLLVR